MYDGASRTERLSKQPRQTLRPALAVFFHRTQNVLVQRVTKEDRRRQPHCTAARRSLPRPLLGRPSVERSPAHAAHPQCGEAQRKGGQEYPNSRPQPSKGRGRCQNQTSQHPHHRPPATHTPPSGRATGRRARRCDPACSSCTRDRASRDLLYCRKCSAQRDRRTPKNITDSLR